MLKDRLKQARIAKNITQSELAKRVGVSASSIMFLENGRNQNSKHLYNIAKVLNVSVDWLLGNEEGISEPPHFEPNAGAKGSFNLWDDHTPLDEDDVEIPFLKDVALSAGNGSLADTDHNGYKLRFSKSSLRKMGVDPSNAICVSAHGNSMYPVIPENTTVGVDLSKNIIKDGDIYAFSIDSELYIKVLYRDLDGMIRVFSYNTIEHPVRLIEASRIHVIGRIFWWSVLR